jgi:DNA-binding CsgD family transcriptional regulator
LFDQILVPFFFHHVYFIRDPVLLSWDCGTINGVALLLFLRGSIENFFSNREVADLLTINPRAIEKHLANILSRLCPNRRTQPVPRAKEHEQNSESTEEGLRN